MHTLFDYVFGSTSMDIETGLNISGWSNPSGNGPKNGGLSPLIDDALNVGSKEQRTTERTLIEEFCKQLFYRSKLGDEFHHLLLASVFKHWQAMVTTCTVNLRLKTHSVIDYVNQVLSVCNIPRPVFDKWCSNTILAFKLKNISALDYDEIKDLPEGATVDVRNFVDQQERLINMVNHTNQKMVTALGTVIQIRDEQWKEQTQRDIMEARQDKIDAKQDSIEAKLDIILSFHHLKVPESNTTTQLSTGESVLNQTSIQPTSDINESHQSQISFRQWVQTMAKGKNNKICPIRSFLHNEQFNLEAGHQLDKTRDLNDKKFYQNQYKASMSDQ